MRQFSVKKYKSIRDEAIFFRIEKTDEKHMVAYYTNIDWGKVNA